MKKDLVAPSYEKTMDAFIKTFADVKYKDIIKSQESGYDRQRTKEFVNNIKHANKDELLDAAYMSFSSSLMADTKARKKFFDILKNQGYNAIIDENDKRFGAGLTAAPVIVFDSSDVKVKSVYNIPVIDAEYFSELLWGGQSESKKYDKSRKRWEKWSGHDPRDI